MMRSIYSTITLSSPGFYSILKTGEESGSSNGAANYSIVSVKVRARNMRQ